RLPSAPGPEAGRPRLDSRHGRLYHHLLRRRLQRLPTARQRLHLTPPTKVPRSSERGTDRWLQSEHSPLGRISSMPSFPRKRESRASDEAWGPWIPAFAGMTEGREVAFVCDLRRFPGAESLAPPYNAATGSTG